MDKSEAVSELENIALKDESKKNLINTLVEVANSIQKGGPELSFKKKHIDLKLDESGKLYQGEIIYTEDKYNIIKTENVSIFGQYSLENLISTSNIDLTKYLLTEISGKDSNNCLLIFDKNGEKITIRLPADSKSTGAGEEIKIDKLEATFSYFSSVAFLELFDGENKEVKTTDYSRNEKPLVWEEIEKLYVEEKLGNHIEDLNKLDSVEVIIEDEHEFGKEIVIVETDKLKKIILPYLTEE